MHVYNISIEDFHSGSFHFNSRISLYTKQKHKYYIINSQIYSKRDDYMSILALDLIFILVLQCPIIRKNNPSHYDMPEGISTVLTYDRTYILIHKL